MKIDISTFFHILSKYLLACILGSVCCMESVGQPTQVIELNVSEQQDVKINGVIKSITLVSLEEYTEPYFQLADSQVVDAVVRADVELEINGQRKIIQGGPFQLPVILNGVSVLVGCTRGFSSGIFKDGLIKDVRLELKDSRFPWYSPTQFSFPIRDYRWHTSNYHHTYLGVVPNIARLYYHRGEDMGMIPDIEKVLSMTEGVLIKRPEPEGDGGSNVLWIQDSSGMIVRYVHMNEYNIEESIHQGDKIRLSQKLGLTGNTYAGHRSPSPHLHVSLHNENNDRIYLNSFPAIVTAYQHTFPGELIPIAGNLHHLYSGDETILDGTRSIAGKGRKITSYEWILSDGTKSNSSRVEKKYLEPGTYSEELRVEDDKGRWDRDFVEVFVLSNDQNIKPPRAWINYYPIRHIRPQTKVRFLIRYVNLKNLTIDYGDGVAHQYSEWSTHKYSKPGNYIVTVKGESIGAGPGIFHVRVIVEQ